MSARIKIEENGPLRVEGEFDLIGPNDESLLNGTYLKIALCRCGKSGKLPFCDGTHKKGLTPFPKPGSAPAQRRRTK